MKRWLIAAAIAVVLNARPAWAHRVDELLQAATLRISSGQLQLKLRIIPGVSVARAELDAIDSDRNGIIADAELQMYGLRVMRDLVVTFDSALLGLSLDSARVENAARLTDGSGIIQLVYNAPLPAGGENHRLVFENHHQPKTSVYLVNSYVPEDPRIHLGDQDRSYTQSRYDLRFSETASVRRASAAVGVTPWLVTSVGLFAVLGSLLGMLLSYRHRVMRYPVMPPTTAPNTLNPTVPSLAFPHE